MQSKSGVMSAYLSTIVGDAEALRPFFTEATLDVQCEADDENSQCDEIEPFGVTNASDDGPGRDDAHAVLSSTDNKLRYLPPQCS